MPPTKQGFSSGAGRRVGFPEPRGRGGRWDSRRLCGPADWQGASSRVAAAGLAPMADMSVFAVPATSVPWNLASARRAAFPWRPLGKLERVARRQTCRPRPRVTLALLPWFSGWKMSSPQDLIVAGLNLYLLPPGSLCSPTGEVHAWHGEMVFFALKAELMAPSVAHV